MDKSEVVLVMTAPVRSKVQELATVIEGWQRYSNEKAILLHWPAVEWMEEIGRPECTLASALADCEQEEFLLLRTWGDDAVDIDGCFWNNGFKVVLKRSISFDGKSDKAESVGVDYAETVKLIRGVVHAQEDLDSGFEELLFILINAILGGEAFQSDNYEVHWIEQLREYFLEKFPAESPLWKYFPIEPTEEEKEYNRSDEDEDDGDDET